jgi:hypothetical protein
MKNVLLVLFVLSQTKAVIAQPGLRVKAGASIKAVNGAFVVLNNTSLVNDGSIQQTVNSSTFKFTGTTVDTIKGNGNFTFDKLQIAKNNGSWIVLNSNIQVINQVTFTSGLLDLGNNTVDLESTGVLVGETESSRAMGAGSGYLQATATLNTPNASNPGNLGAIITSANNLGSTVIRRGHTIQTGINGSGTSIRRYFDIQPTVNSSLNATLRLSYFNAELSNISEATLALWRRTGTAWANLSSTSQDTITNYVEKKAVQNFDRMTLAAGCPPINLSIPDVYAVNPGGSANTLYIGYGTTSLTLLAQKSGGTAPYTYKWTIGSAGGAAASLDSFLTVNPTAQGSYTYYLTVNDVYGCKTAVVSKTITVRDIRCGKKLDMVTVCQNQNGTYSTACVSSTKVPSLLSSGSYLDSCQITPPAITQRETISNGEFVINAFPNPSSNYFTLTTHSSKQQPLTITITNSLGQVIEKRNEENANGHLNLGYNYRPGIYIIEVIQGNQVRALKVVKIPD